MGTRSKQPLQGTSRRDSARTHRRVPRGGSLADALFTSTQQRLLSLLFGQPDRSFFTRELIELAASGSGAVQRELTRLTDAGLVIMTRQGNQKRFQANRGAPIFDELRGMVLKTVGLAEPIKAALASLSELIQLALVYGSIAKRSDTASSDVDLLIASNHLSLEEVYRALAPAEQAVSRKINVTLLTAEEFKKRRTDKSPFLSKVLAGEHLVLFGDADGVAAPR